MRHMCTLLNEIDAATARITSILSKPLSESKRAVAILN